MKTIPDPNAIFPNEYKTSCFLKNVVKAPNIVIGDYTYYDDDKNPTDLYKIISFSIIRSSETD